MAVSKSAPIQKAPHGFCRGDACISLAPDFLAVISSFVFLIVRIDYLIRVCGLCNYYAALFPCTQL